MKTDSQIIKVIIDPDGDAKEIKCVPYEFAMQIEKQLVTVTEQRDKLTEALNKLCYMHQNHALTVASYEAIKKTLQSLSVNNP